MLECREAWLVARKGIVIAHSPADCAEQTLVQYAHHEMLMPSAVLDIIRAEAKRQRRLKTKTRIVAGMPDEEYQTKSAILHRF